MKKTITLVTAGLIGTVAALGSSKELGAIWFIGDSITQSNADDDPSGSPRKSLYNLLTGSGYTFTYTGHHTRNTDGLPTTGTTAADNLYHYHSGISGSVIGDDYSTRVGMTQQMEDFWTSGRLAVVKPDVILILLGTNDIDIPYDVPNAPARLKALVQSIYNLPGIGSPSIYLASIPPNGRDSTKTANVITFNSFIPGIVADFQNEGKDIHFVDQFTPLNNNYATVMRSDNLHPIAAGNDLMAQTWFDEISNRVDTVIDAGPLSGTVPLTVDFDASASTGTSPMVSYRWNFGDGSTASGVTTSHTYTEPGTYQAILIASTASNRTGVASVEVSVNEWAGTPTDFHGYDLYAFTTNGLSGKVAVPDEVAEGRPWIWRARFWDHQSGPDVALLGAGYHVVYVDVKNLFGSPTAVARFDAFYDFLTEEHGFDDRAVLEGMSRGGLAIYNWAAQNPDKVHCVYADAPVCDFKSWPGGFYDGDGSTSSWTTCLSVYGFTEAEALAYGGNPVDNMQPLAAAGIPLLHVVGDADTVVPAAENTALVESRYHAMGGWIYVIHKPGVGHVHGLDDPSPIVDFILNSMNDIHNLEPSDVEANTATLNGLLSLPGTNYDLQIHWGLTDGGTNAGAWDHSASMRSWTTGDSNRVSYAVSALAPNATYSYSFSATNVNESVWDDSVSFSTSHPMSSSVVIEGVYTPVDLAYATYASASDLVNAGAATLASGPMYSSTPSFGAAANNNGTIGGSSTAAITFWTSAAAGSSYSITYSLDTSVHTLGYDITSLQTIHGWHSYSGNQKNQNYTVDVSTVDSSGFFNIAAVAYFPFSSENTAGSTMVSVTDSSGTLASKVDAIRFTYTVPTSGGTYPSPTIREIDVFGVPSADRIIIPQLSNSLSISNGNFITQFTGSISSHYQVEYSNDLLSSNSWTVVTDIISLVTSPMVISMPVPHSSGFYRVIGLP